jgi:hypothetical protein
MSDAFFRFSNSCVVEVWSRQFVCAKPAFRLVTPTSFSGMGWDSKCLCLMRSVIQSRPAKVSRSLWPSSTPGTFSLKSKSSKSLESPTLISGAFNLASPSFSSVSEFLQRLKTNAVPSFKPMQRDSKQCSAATQRVGVLLTEKRSYAFLRRAGSCKHSASITALLLL